MKGVDLPSNSYFSFTAIDDHRAFVFGGNVAGRRVNNLYVIDFNTMVGPNCNNQFWCVHNVVHNVVHRHTIVVIIVCVCVLICRYTAFPQNPTALKMTPRVFGNASQ